MRVDFGEFMRICQSEKVFKTIFLSFFFISCSHEVITDKTNERKFSPNWLKMDINHVLVGKDDQYLTHPFFDIQPKEDSTSEIRYFTMTPKNSRFQYNLDLLSGSLYKVREYCANKDIWENYSSKISRPNFDLGGMPKTFDQLGEIQKIIVFKEHEEISPFEYNISYYNEAKLLGSVLIEKCDSYPCSTKDKWKKFQILVGVNKNDPTLGSVQTLSELKKKVDWKYAKAFLVNQFGTHQVGVNYYPAYRIASDLDLNETQKHFKKFAKPVDMKEMIEMRDRCVAMYDEMWKQVNFIKLYKFDQQDEFYKYFKKFYGMLGTDYYKCQKYVRPANINLDPERHWFFTYISAFSNLERSGLYYNCNQKGWAYNARTDENSFYVDQNKELARCHAKDFEKSFDQAINGLSLMRTQLSKVFRYVEYDSSLGGSHQKIYSWIMDEYKKTPCEPEINSVDVFPQDVVWPTFKPNEAKTVH